MGMFNDLQKLDQKDKQTAATTKRKRPSFPGTRIDELGPSPQTVEPSPQQSHTDDVMHSRRHDAVTSGSHDVTQTRPHDVTPQRYDEGLIEGIRKQVRLVGRESTTIRLTADEKRHLEDIEYTLRRQGIDTSHNELCRIAIHHLLADYEKAGKESVLARVLAVLHS